MSIFVLYGVIKSRRIKKLFTYKYLPDLNEILDNIPYTSKGVYIESVGEGAKGNFKFELK